MSAENVIEHARLRALHRSGLLQGHSIPKFDNITDLVRDMLGVPVSVVSILSDDRQVFAGHYGLPPE